jgi:hypothetical protein
MSTGLEFLDDKQNNIQDRSQSQPQPPSIVSPEAITGLEFLNEDPQVQPKPPRHMIDISASNIDPESAKIEQQRLNALRNYFELGQSPWLVPLIPGQSLDTLEAPKPPGGFGKKGEPLDEGGVPYKTPSLSTELRKAVSDISNRVYTRTTAIADSLGVKAAEVGGDLYEAFTKVTKEHPIWTKIGKNAVAIPEAAMSLGSGIMSTMAALATKYTYMAQGMSEDEARELSERGASLTTYQPYTEEGAFLAKAGGYILGIPFELAHTYVASPARKLFEQSMAHEFIKWAGGRPELVGMPYEELITFFIGAKGLHIGVKGTRGAAKAAVESITKSIEAKGLESAFNYTPSSKPPPTPYTGTDFKLTPVMPTTSGKVETKVVEDKDIPSIEPNMIEKAKTRITEIEDIQAELAAKKEIVDKVDIEEVVKEDLKIKGEKVKKAKVAKAKELVEPEPEAVEPVTKTGLEFIEESIVKPKDTVTIPNKADELSTLKTKLDNKEIKPGDYIKEKKRIQRKMDIEEAAKEILEITKLDELTGTLRPKELDTESSPFRDKNIKHTDTMNKLFTEKIKSVESSPETYTRYLINEVNRWLNGEKVSINEIKDRLSDMSTRADELSRHFAETNDFNIWKDTVSEAAKWAREADRLIVKQTGGVQLNMMIPVDQIPSMVKDVLKGIKTTVGNVLYRNKEVFDATGYWLGRDRKWRYEIGDEGLKVKPELLDREVHDLTEVVSHPTLFDAVPELRNLKIIVKEMKENLGQYSAGGKIITVKYPEKDIIVHEVQHAVNDIMESKFRGSSPEAQEIIRTSTILSKMKKVAKDSKIIKEIDAAINIWQGSNKTVSLRTLVDPIFEKAERISVSEYEKISEIFFGEDTPFESYMKDPGELEARLSEKRMKMTPEQRKTEPPWETLEYMLGDEGIINYPKGLRGDSNFMQSTEGTKLYTGIDPIEIARLVKKTKTDLVNIVKRINELKKLKKTKKATKEHTVELTELYNRHKELIAEQEEYTLESKKLSEASDDATTQAIADLKAREPYTQASIIKLADAHNKGMKKAVEMKEFNIKEATKLLRRKFTASFAERSGTTRRLLAKDDRGYEAMSSMYMARGGHPKAFRVFEQMRKEVDGGLSADEKFIKNGLIRDLRILDIVKYKTPKQFTPPADATPQMAAMYTTMFRSKEINKIRDLTPEEAHRLYHVREDGTVGGRVGAYFDWMRKAVKDAYEEGLLSEQEMKDLTSHNYKKTRLVVEDIFDRKNEIKVGGKKLSVYDSGIERLAKGKTTDIYELDSNVVALETFNTLYSRIFKNRANRDIYDLAIEEKENSFARVKQSKGDKIPENFRHYTTDVFIDGKKKTIFLSDDIGPEWIMSNAQVTYKYAQFMRYASFSPLVKTFATGINQAFALRNLPRDAMQAWFTSRVLRPEKSKVFGRFQSVYSPTLPIAAYQLGKHYSKIFKDAALRRGTFDDYIDDGGGMELLTPQGRLLFHGKHLEPASEAFYKFAGYLGTTSEILGRMSIKNKVIETRAKEKGISFEEAYKDKKIRKEATFAARDYMDFSQGGDIVKALDNAIPFLNAKLVAMRGFIRAWKDQPVVSAYKLTQFAALVTGLYLGNQELHPDTMKDLKGDRRTQGNLVFPLGDMFGFKDSMNDTRYPFIMIPINQDMRFFKTLFEGGVDWMTGEEVDTERIGQAWRDLSPVEVTTLPPTVSGALGYATNKDFWLGKDIVPKAHDYRLPKILTGEETGSSEEEWDKDTPQVAKDIGKVTSMSPERLKYLMGQLITNDNMYAQLLGKAYEGAFGDLPQKDREATLAESLSKVPVIKAFFGITNPYSKFADTLQQAKDKAEIDNFIETRGLDIRVDAYLIDNTMDRVDVVNYIREFKNKDIEDKLMKDFKFQEYTKDLSNRYFWTGLKRIPDIRRRAEVYVKRLDASNEKEFQQLMDEVTIVTRAGGIFSKEFNDEVARVRSGQ